MTRTLLGRRKHTLLTDFRHVHWRKFITRKVIVLAIFGAIGYAAEHYLHLWFAGKGGEIAFGTIIEHTFFEVPMEGGE
jgi:hypothetical protein